MKRQRQVLLRLMNDLSDKGFNCSGCLGTCCTFEANSMLLTPVEARDLYLHLKSKNLITEELKTRLENSIKDYRLEPKFLNQKRKSYLRKTYTCPFFNHQELGCPFPPEVKPYGCLAFNAHHASEKAGPHCYSETDVLEKRESDNPEEESLNEAIRKEFDLFWEKSPIPNALLDLWNKL